MTVGQEIELKFEVDPAAIGRLEEALVLRPGSKAPEPAVEQLLSVYYDTVDRDLMKAGFTLRLRDEGGSRVQTVKSEAEGLAVRGEWETPAGGNGLDLDAAGRTPAGPVLQKIDARLQPVFTTRVERTRRLVRQGKARVEAALDRGEIEAGARTAPICELELELKDGPPAGLYDLARRLSQAAPIRLNFVSKAERGYRLLQNETSPAAVKQQPLLLQRGMTARDAFRAIASSAMRQWLANAAVFADVRRPEALHQMRVALRRLRTAFKLFEEVTVDEDWDRLMGEVKWLAGELDQGRDLDVLIAETFRPAAARLDEQTGMAALGERLHRARARAYDRALAALTEPRYLSLVIDMAAWIDCGRWSDPADPAHGPKGDRPVEQVAREGLDKLRRQIKRRGRGLETIGPEQRHKVRIRAKRLRYGLEFFGGLYPDRQDELAAMLDRLKGLQDGLGALNDMAVALDKGLEFAESGGRAADETETEGHQQAYAAGLAIGMRLTATEGGLRQACKDYGRLMHMKPFWRK